MHCSNPFIISPVFDSYFTPIPLDLAYSNCFSDRRRSLLHVCLFVRLFVCFLLLRQHLDRGYRDRKGSSLSERTGCPCIANVTAFCIWSTVQLWKWTYLDPQNMLTLYEMKVYFELKSSGRIFTYFLPLHCLLESLSCTCTSCKNIVLNLVMHINGEAIKFLLQISSYTNPYYGNKVFTFT